MTDEKDVVNDLFLEDWRQLFNKFLKRCESVLRAENLCVGEYKMEKSKGKDTDYVNGSIIDNDNNNDDDV
ncbi:13628_t:CDS:2 [Entrophospora sp. SA101]|nr:13628_t:CDS:2 [Entrophospora sp. SA101]